jgi:hypothetical protein
MAYLWLMCILFHLYCLDRDDCDSRQRNLQRNRGSCCSRNDTATLDDRDLMRFEGSEVGQYP